MKLWQDTLHEIAERIRLINAANGWYDRSRTFSDEIALLHSEVSEMFEAYRSHGLEDFTHDGHMHLADGDDCKVCKPKGVGSEAADILIRLLDTCSRYNINLGEELIRKLDYNMTREYRHGNKIV